MKKIILLFLCLSGVLRAQENSTTNASTATAADAINLTFKTVGFRFARSDLFLKQAKGYTPLTVDANSVSSKTYTYKGPVNMAVYRLVKTADQISYVPVATVSFPAMDPKLSGRFLLIFSGANATAMNITAVNDDTASFPLQSVRVINTLPAAAGVKVNQNSLMIAPGQTQFFQVQNAQDDRVEIHVAVQHRAKWIEANNNVFAIDKDSRRTVFLVNNTSPNAPAYQPPAIGFLSLADKPNEKPIHAEEDAPKPL